MTPTGTGRAHGAGAPAAPVDPVQRLRIALPALTGAKRRVAELMIGEPARVGAASITTLADEAKTQPAVISRLSMRLGYTGYPALRAALASAAGRNEEAAWQADATVSIRSTDPAERVLRVLTGRQFDAMRKAMASIELRDMELLAEWIARAERVCLFAEQDDLAAALDLRLRLRTLGVPTVLRTAGTAARETRPNDVALVMSRTGDSAAGVDFLSDARRGGARVAVITGEVDSILGGAADLTIFTGTRAGSSPPDAYAGRTSDVLAGALLWMLVAQRLPDALTSDLGPDDL